MMLNIISQKQFDIEKKIRREGFVTRWDKVGGKPNKQNIEYVRFEDNKVAITPHGNVLLCSVDGCFTFVGKSGLVCGTHAKGIQTHKHCRSKDLCLIAPLFGYIENEPLFCYTHKEPDMKNIKTPKCLYIYENGIRCTTIPSYALEGDNRKFCAEHRHYDMIN